MPSTATSCTAANDITTKPTRVSMPMSVGSGMKASASIDRVSPPCAASTHGRRRPMDGMPKRSMNGPETSFNAHGSVTTPTNVPISPMVAPCAASHATRGICSSPIGTPCAKYRAVSAPKRSRRELARIMV